MIFGGDGTTLNATFYNFLNPGHLAYNDSEAGRTGTLPLQVIHSFAQNQIQQNDPIYYNWIILDTCSSASVLENKVLAKNVRNCKSDKELIMLTNGVHLSVDKTGELLFLTMKFT